MALQLTDGGQTRMILNASIGDAVIGGNGVDGVVKLRNHQTKETIRLDGEYAHIIAGGGGKTGTRSLYNADGEVRFYLGSTGTLRVGGNGVDGDVYVFRAEGSKLTARLRQEKTRCASLVSEQATYVDGAALVVDGSKSLAI